MKTSKLFQSNIASTTNIDVGPLFCPVYFLSRHTATHVVAPCGPSAPPCLLAGKLAWDPHLKNATFTSSSPRPGPRELSVTRDFCSSFVTLTWTWTWTWTWRLADGAAALVKAWLVIDRQTASSFNILQPL